MNRAERVARLFSAHLVRDYGIEKVQAAHLTNLERVDPGTCATHDFCDANEVMANAFEEIAGCEMNLESEYHREVWNEAWRLAKAAGFYLAEKVLLVCRDGYGRQICTQKFHPGEKERADRIMAARNRAERAAGSGHLWGVETEQV